MRRDEVLQYLKAENGKSFEWGKVDCATLAAGLVEKCTGLDPLEGIVYGTEAEAKRELVARGGLEAAVSAVLGPAHDDLRECRDGDIVLTAFQGQKGLGVAVGRVFYVRRTDGGVWPVDLTLATKFWPCPTSR